MLIATGSVAVDPSFRLLLYRYWFYGWLFRDASRGSLIERAAAWRHNQAARRWLPVYLRRWTTLGALAFGAGCLLELVSPWPLQTLFFVPAVVSASVNVVTFAAWIGLKVMPAPGG
jgi:hypothetical protein